MESKEVEIYYKKLAYEDAIAIADKSITKKEIKRHLKLRLESIEKESALVSSKFTAVGEKGQ